MSSRAASALLVLSTTLGVATGCSTSGTASYDVGPGTTLQRADALLRAGRGREAAELYCSLAAAGDPNPMREKEALAWLVAGEADLAGSALAEAPLEDSSRGQTLAAVLAWQSEASDDARAHLDRAVILDEDNAAAWALKGEVLLQQEAYPQAEECLDIASGLLNPTDPLKRTVLHNLTIARLMRYDYAGADEAFSAFLALQGKARDEDVLLAGALAYAVRDHARAADYWRHLDANLRRELAAQLGGEDAAYAALAQAHPTKERHEL